MSFDSKKIEETRISLQHQMSGVINKAKSEGRIINAEERAQYDKMFDEDARLKDEYESVLRMERHDSTVNQAVKEVRRLEQHVRPDDHDKAILSWLYTKAQDNNRALRYADSAQRVGLNPNAEFLDLKLMREAPKTRAEIRGTNPQSTSSNLGGEFVPTTMASFIEKALLAYSPVRPYANVIRTVGGGAFRIPTVSDTSSKAVIIAENDANTVGDVATDVLSLGAYTYTTKFIKVSMELEEDSAFSWIGGFLGELLGERMARGQNEHLTKGLGSGSTQPQGFVTGAALGKTLASSSVITAEEIYDLYYSLPLAYRDSPSAVFVMSETCARAVRAIVDENGRSLWEVGGGLINGNADRLLGKPVIINTYMDAMGSTAKKPAIFADFSKFLVREVSDFQISVARELFLNNRQVGIVGHARMDSKVLTSSAFKYLATPAS